MKFRSTRGQVNDVTFQEGIFMGYANDGGLLVPESIPKIDLQQMKLWKDLSYVDLAIEILSLFISDCEITKTELRGIVVKAYGSDFKCPVSNFPGSLHILELFHGKTKAFKDIALALTAQFLDFFLAKERKHITLLVATSGDTGSAAIESVRKSKNIDIIVLFPKGYCTKVQELQMTTVLDNNVHVICVEGSSDDADIPMKACLVDKDFAGKYNLGSVNSINVSRILAQVVYYFYAYFKVCKEIGETVKIVVPTGGMGNVTAGCIASKMGLPILLHSAVNENNCVFKTLTNGIFVQSQTTTNTWSTAMDIQNPYNMERILYLFSDFNSSLVSSLMEDFEAKRSVEIPFDLKEKIGRTLTSDWVCMDDVLATMKSFWDTNHYVLCPHTAIGIAAAYRDSTKKTETRVCIATASPAKFIDAVKAAQVEFTPPPEILMLEKMATRFELLKKDDDWEDVIRRKIIEIGAAARS